MVDGKIVKTSRRPFNSFPDMSIDRICLRGLSQVYNIYGPNRVQYPMRRVGERGAGEWERITWDEAVDEIARKWQEIREKYGDQAIAYTRGSGNLGTVSGVASPMFNVFFNKINSTQIKIARDQANTRGINRVMGNLGDWVLNDPSVSKTPRPCSFGARTSPTRKFTTGTLSPMLKSRARSSSSSTPS